MVLEHICISLTTISHCPPTLSACQNCTAGCKLWLIWVATLLWIPSYEVLSHKDLFRLLLHACMEVYVYDGTLKYKHINSQIMYCFSKWRRCYMRQKNRRLLQKVSHICKYIPVKVFVSHTQVPSVCDVILLMAPSGQCNRINLSVNASLHLSPNPFWAITVSH